MDAPQKIIALSDLLYRFAFGVWKFKFDTAGLSLRTLVAGEKFLFLWQYHLVLPAHTFVGEVGCPSGDSVIFAQVSREDRVRS